MNGKPIHIRQSQHWTYCFTKVAEVERIVDRRGVGLLVRAYRPDPGEPPPEVCERCYHRWREDPDRRR